MIKFFGAIQFNNIISQPDNTSVYLAVLRTSLIRKNLKKTSQFIEIKHGIKYYFNVCWVRMLRMTIEISPYNSHPHVFAGPLSPGEALVVHYLRKCWRWGKKSVYGFWHLGILSS